MESPVTHRQHRVLLMSVVGVILGSMILLMLLHLAQSMVREIPSQTNGSVSSSGGAQLAPVIPWYTSTSSITVLPPSETNSASTTMPILGSATSVRLLVVGDLMLDRNVARRAHDAGDFGYPFRKLHDGWLNSFDYTVANMEGSMTDKRRDPVKSIDFQFDPAFLPTLQQQGFDAFSQANNHALDQGSIGYADSVRRLREAGFLVFGHQVQDGDIALATTTVKGIRFAFVGFNATDNPVDRTDAAAVIAKAKSQSDIVIADMHWGAEYQDHPIPQVVELSHWLIDQGVDIVIGGHPHWVQGIFKYKEHPIVYSVGNFVFDQDFSVETRQGMGMELQFDSQNIHAVSLRPIPLQIDVSQPRVVEGEEYKKRIEQFAKISGEDVKDAVRNGSVGFAW